jgi:hypothetical protein
MELFDDIQDPLYRDKYLYIVDIYKQGKVYKESMLVWEDVKGIYIEYDCSIPFYELPEMLLCFDAGELYWCEPLILPKYLLYLSLENAIDGVYNISHYIIWLFYYDSYVPKYLVYSIGIMYNGSTTILYSDYFAKCQYLIYIYEDGKATSHYLLNKYEYE